MSDLSLELSEKFRDEADGIQAELSKHLKVGRPSIVFSSVGRSNPALIYPTLG